MQMMNFNRVPVGGLVLAERTGNCVEPSVMWGIKARFGNEESPHHAVSIFWLGSENGQPGFDLHFQGAVFLVSPSFRLTCDLDTCEILGSLHNAFDEGRFGLHLAESPFFTGQVFDRGGAIMDECLCAHDGVLRKFLKSETPQHEVVRVTEWTVSPSNDFDFGWLDKIDGRHRPF